MKNRKKLSLDIKVYIIGFILVTIAGWIDAISLHVFLEKNSSFLTGRVAMLGKFILAGEKTGALKIALIIVFYIVGACISAKLTQMAGLSLGLYFSAGLILLTLIGIYTAHATTIAYIALPMSMGSQNAATSLTNISRTTHLTGPITDIGISLAIGDVTKALFWLSRVLGFLIGAIAATHFIAKGVSLFFILIAPAAIIGGIAFYQKTFLEIPVISVKERG